MSANVIAIIALLTVAGLSVVNVVLLIQRAAEERAKDRAIEQLRQETEAREKAEHERDDAVRRGEQTAVALASVQRELAAVQAQRDAPPPGPGTI